HPLGELPVHSGEIILSQEVDIEEISVSDSDIVLDDRSRANLAVPAMPFEGNPFTENTRSAPPGAAELEAIFDQETDAAFAALQAVEAIAAPPSRASTAQPLADKAPW